MNKDELIIFLNNNIKKYLDFIFELDNEDIQQKYYYKGCLNSFQRIIEFINKSEDKNETY